MKNSLKIKQIELSMLKLEKRILAAERKSLRVQSELIKRENRELRKKIHTLTCEINECLNPKLYF